MIHQEVQKGIDVPFTFERYDSTGQVIPTSGTYAIKDNAGTAVTNSTLTIDAVGTMTFTFATADNDALGSNFKIILTYVIGGVTTRENILFDVVETPLINIVTDKDLFIHIPVIRDRLFEKQGETTATGSTTTIVDTSLSADSRDWTGARGRITQSANTIEFRVSSYVRSTSTITISPSITSTVSGEFYILRQSFDETIDDAYNNARQDIRNKIGCTAGYIDSNVIKNMTIYYALMTICRGNVEVVDDKWSVWKTDFSDLYKREFEKLNEPYDSSGDGNLSDQENTEKPNGSTIRINR